MDCKTAQSLVIPYINDQLSDEETEDFLEHIENCKECYEELEIHFTVHYALQKLDEDDKISFNIPKMLKENLRDTKPDPQEKDFSWGDGLRGGSGGDSASSDGYDPAGNVPGEEYWGDRTVSVFPSGIRGRDGNIGGNRDLSGDRDRSSDAESAAYGAAGSLGSIRPRKLDPGIIENKTEVSHE